MIRFTEHCYRVLFLFSLSLLSVNQLAICYNSVEIFSQGFLYNSDTAQSDSLFKLCCTSVILHDLHLHSQRLS